MDGSANPPTWRDRIKVHPAADLFPMMTEAELDELAADIAKHGLTNFIVLWTPESAKDIGWLSGKEPSENYLLDGRNRLAAIERGFIDPKKRAEKIKHAFDVANQYYGETNPFEYVVSANLHRRHLTPERKREVIAALLKAQPERSDRAIGKLAQASPTTVGKVRQDLEKAGDVSNLDTRTDSKGRQQPASKIVAGRPRPDPAAQRGQPRRDGPDFWPTPHSLITALVRFVLPELPSGPIWECAAGDGRIAEAIHEAGRLVVASDLHLHDTAAPPRDFLKDKSPIICPIVVTNPPFNQIEEFLGRGLDLLDAGHIKGLVLLLRHDHLIATTRAAAFNRAVREVNCNWRPIWIEDTEGNPRWSFHWLVWHGGPRQPPLYLSLSDVE